MIYETECLLGNGQLAQGLRSASKSTLNYRVAPSHATPEAAESDFTGLEVFSFSLLIAVQSSLGRAQEWECRLVFVARNQNGSDFNPCQKMDSRHTKHGHLMGFESCIRFSLKALRIMHLYFASFSLQYYLSLGCPCSREQHYSSST